MKQFVISCLVAYIGLFVLTSDIHLVQSKAVHAANSSNATNASRRIAELSANLSHVQQLVLNLTHQLEHVKLNQANGTGQNASRIVHSVPVVHQVKLNQTNSTGASQNASRIVHSVPVLHQVKLNQTNSTGLNPNSSLVSSQNVSQIYLLTLRNTQQIESLELNISRIALFVANLSRSLNQTNSTRPSQNVSRIVHSVPVVHQVKLNQTNSTGSSQNRTQIHQFPVVLHQIKLNQTNSTGPSPNVTQIHLAPVHLPIALNVTKVNATKVSNQTHALAKNISNIQDILGNLTKTIELMKLY